MDAIDLVTSDHRTVEELFASLRAATDDAGRLDVAHDLIRELSVHAVVEEQILYPGARRVLGDDALVDHAIEEHDRLKQVLADLDGTSPDDERFLAGFQLAEQLVQAHVAEEEGTLLPHLREQLDAAELDKLGAAMAAAKKVSPTRPHPHAPSSPPGNVVVGPVVAMVDKVRDAARDALSR
jgi:hemerythrin superfamily protein